MAQIDKLTYCQLDPCDALSSEFVKIVADGLRLLQLLQPLSSMKLAFRLEQGAGVHSGALLWRIEGVLRALACFA